MRKPLPVSSGSDPGEQSSPEKLARLLRPKSIAIVGASAREAAFGTRLLAGIRRGRYSGKIFPVNPRYEQLDGLPCYPDLAAIPERVDLATFAVSDDVIEAALTEAAEAGVGAGVIFGRAYEAHAEGRPEKSERLAAIARAAKMAVCGNNCMGFINFVDGLTISGNPPPIPETFGSVGLISHSGSTWSGLIGNQRQLVFNYAVSAGQEIATSVAEYFEFLLAQPETRVIACILETVRDPERFVAALEQADRQGIPIVALKLGRSERGRSFALAHSGALAGSDAAYGAIFERHNVVRVYSVDELTDTVEVLNAPRRAQGGGIGIATDSGGERELIVDIASDVGAPIADVTPDTSARLAEILDPGMAPVNPVDSYGDGRMLLGEALGVLAKDPNVGIVALATNLVHGRPYLYASTAALERVHAGTDKLTLVFGNLHSSISREEAARLRGLGIPVLMGTQTALLAMKHLLVWQQRHGADGGRLPGSALPVPPRIAALARPAEGSKAVSPGDATEILEHYGIPVARSLFASNENDAVAAARAIGMPVVLKTAAPEVLHKTESGGVVTELRTPEAVAEAYARIASKCGPHVQIQAQVESGTEILLGMTNDPQFGPMVTVGLGGIMTELFGDVVTFSPAATAADAAQYLQRLKGYPLLNGFRGRPRANIEALSGTIERFSRLCVEAGSLFFEIDLNPVIVGPKAAVAVDALMIPRSSSAN